LKLSRDFKNVLFIPVISIFADIYFVIDIYFVLKVSKNNYFKICFIFILVILVFLLSYGYKSFCIGFDKLLSLERKQIERFIMFKLSLANKTLIRIFSGDSGFYHELVTEDGLNKFLKLRLSLFIYILNPINIMFLFKEIIYLLIIFFVFVNLEWDKYISILLITIAILIPAFLLKLTIITSEINKLFNMIFYIYENSVSRLADFYIHPELLKMMEFYKSNGIITFILKGIRYSFPFIGA
jgi:ABC-type multidrug transport system fused ATPase/permease subunit